MINKNTSVGNRPYPTNVFWSLMMSWIIPRARTAPAGFCDTDPSTNIISDVKSIVHSANQKTTDMKRWYALAMGILIVEFDTPNLNHQTRILVYLDDKYMFRWQCNSHISITTIRNKNCLLNCLLFIFRLGYKLSTYLLQHCLESHKWRGPASQQGRHRGHQTTLRWIHVCLLALRLLLQSHPSLSEIRIR